MHSAFCWMKHSSCQVDLRLRPVLDVTLGSLVTSLSLRFLLCKLRIIISTSRSVVRLKIRSVRGGACFWMERPNRVKMAILSNELSQTPQWGFSYNSTKRTLSLGGRIAKEDVVKEESPSEKSHEAWKRIRKLVTTMVQHLNADERIGYGTGTDGPKQVLGHTKLEQGSATRRWVGGRLNW